MYLTLNQVFGCYTTTGKPRHDKMKKLILIVLFPSRVVFQTRAINENFNLKIIVEVKTSTDDCFKSTLSGTKPHHNRFKNSKALIQSLNNFLYKAPDPYKH